ncbi:MAG: GNAT family N-acetyltransferase [Gemmatimonadetes bacterium]|jgi:GNAT superfamily N-acetyltransferase|nr:GNAT family N-acetyltransferase [Gemmatimonadota bacterium]MBT6146038.1 GNAT family N-acetyltransferase [Gemmatimonadota bacterium]MBT7861863.1 GNAT family N-acetyltransferase [Gemmatimonadota bacterium]
MSCRLVTIQQQPELADRVSDLIEKSWPQFMLQDPIGNKHWNRLYADFPECQVIMLDGDEVIGQGNTIPIRWDGPSEQLPDQGWDWAFIRGVEGYDQGRAPTHLTGLQIVIDPGYQGRRLSSQFVEHFRGVAQAKGLSRLVIPLRPTRKHQYPLTPMDRYITWTRQGLPFDPWLRIHARAGARIVKSCPESMTITGSIQDWETWTGMAFPDSGSYIVPGALMPVQIDRGADQGTYIEPNVWVEHEVSGSS